MKKSVLLMVLLVFAVAAGFYFLNPVDSVKSPQIPAKETIKVMPLDEKSPVRWLQVQNLTKNETVTLEKKDGEWVMIYPVTYPAETVAVQGLITALKLSGRARRLLPEKDWEEYGLLKPNIKIGIQTEEGKTRRYLYLGDDSPVGPFAYARWEGEEEYFLIQRDLKRAFDRTVYSLRLKQVFRVLLKDVTKMRVRSVNYEYEVEKRPDGNWYWLEPIPLLGKPLAKRYVDQIVSQYGDLFVKEFLDNEKKSPEELGFGILSPWIKLWGRNPTVSARSQDPEGPVLAGSDKKKAAEQIIVGQELASRDSFIARREGEPGYFLVARENVRKLFQIFETMSQEALTPSAETPAPDASPASELVDLRAPGK